MIMFDSLHINLDIENNLLTLPFAILLWHFKIYHNLQDKL